MACVAVCVGGAGGRCEQKGSKSGSKEKEARVALGGAGVSDEELQRLMLEHDAAQDNVILTQAGLRHRHPRELGGDCGGYRWLQTDTEIVVEAPLPRGTLPSQIRVKVHTAYLAVHVKDATVVSGKLSRVRTPPTTPPTPLPLPSRTAQALTGRHGVHLSTAHTRGARLVWAVGGALVLKPAVEMASMSCLWLVLRHPSFAPSSFSLILQHIRVGLADARGCRKPLWGAESDGGRLLLGGGGRRRGE